MGQNLLSMAAAPPFEIPQRFYKDVSEDCRNAPSRYKRVRCQWRTDLARCSPLNWTEHSAEPLSRMIALPIRVALPSIQKKICSF